MASCGYHFCLLCWEGYISTSIKDGPGCLMLRCPAPTCGGAVGQDMINQVAPDEDKLKYSRFLLRSYIEDNKKQEQFLMHHNMHSLVKMLFRKLKSEVKNPSGFLIFYHHNQTKSL
ncbi:putative E3 ubiquitin-protein ligase ari8 [Stylosanthes scabra]|uniref:E3 ubiquitin-protein ligase ari8 n=1 Tax=Stylosanthes scabra TaxID=79078 RepID=A0ABU6QX05_9FABA|nr:putative E3 ubiquitin-protein ligase ari8 [Stylosanthes scabra]